MLGINIDDVLAVIQSIRPQLIAVVVALALAIAVTVAVNRKTVVSQSTRKLAHSTVWVAAASRSGRFHRTRRDPEWRGQSLRQDLRHVPQRSDSDPDVEQLRSEPVRQRLRV